MDLHQAVSDTQKYASFFHYPLSPEEISYWLVSSQPVSYKQLKRYLPSGLSPAQQKIRSKVSAISAQKICHAQRMANILKFVPGLRLIAITGSVAAGNSYLEDDIDLLFITSPHSLWLTRPFVLFLISLFFRRRHPGEDHAKAADAFCPNLWLDTQALLMPPNKRSLYTAHEILQIIPLVNKNNTFQSFLDINSWTKKYLANAYSSLTRSFLIHSPHPLNRKPFDRWSSVPIFFLVAPINYLFFIFQSIYMFPKKTTENVSLHSAYLHTTDYQTQINQVLHLSSSQKRL